MPQDPQSDKDFAKLNPADQQRYLTDTDPDFGKLSNDDKTAYLNHINGRSEPAPPDQLQKDADVTNAWAKYHPIAGPIARGVVSAGQSAMKAITGVPEGIYHSVVDPPTAAETAYNGGPLGLMDRAGLPIYRMMGLEQAGNAIHDYMGRKVTPEAAKSVLPEALGQGIGNVAGGAVYGKMPEALSAMARPVRILARMTPILNKAGEALRSTTPEALAHETEMQAPLRMETDRAIAEGRAQPLDLNKLGGTDPMRAATKQAIAEGRAMKIPPRQLGANAGAAGSVAESVAPVTPGPNLLPEPRATFPGENPNYMASVPRNELNRMAINRKPGAGTQLQQLGEPILYIPNEAGYPGPRR